MGARIRPCIFLMLILFNLGLVLISPAVKAEEYLAFRYGKDWRIPRQNWITSRDDRAVNQEILDGAL